LGLGDELELKRSVTITVANLLKFVVIQLQATVRIGPDGFPIYPRMAPGLEGPNRPVRDITKIALYWEVLR
jgi:hypothetical protein